MNFFISKDDIDKNLFIESNNDLYINKDNSEYYKNIIPNGLNNLLNKVEKKKKSNILDEFSSSSDDEYYMSDNFLGGAVKKKSKIISSKKSKYLKIMPTFINVVKGKILHNYKNKYILEEIHPKSKQVILGTIIDLKKIDEDILNITLEKIHSYISKYEVVPLIYNDSRNVVYKNKKNFFFSKSSKLALLTFKMKSDIKYYCESINSPFSQLHSIDSSKINHKTLIAYFIYQNYYFLFDHPKDLQIHECYLINIKDINSFVFKPFNKVTKIEPNNRKISLDEITQIIQEAKTYLKF